MYLSTVFVPRVPEVISSCLFLFIERLDVTRTGVIIIIIIIIIIIVIIIIQ